MAVATRSTSVTAYSTTATVGPYSIAVPAGLAAGDRLVIRALIQAGSGITSAPTITTPSGLTKTIDPSAANGWCYSGGAPGGVGCVEFQRACDGTEPGSYSFTLGSAQHLTLFAFALTGANASLATDVYGQTAGDATTNGKTTTLPNITTTAAGCFLIESEGAYDASGSGTNPTGSSPTLAELYAGSGDGTLFIATGTQSAAGATGARTRNPNGNSGSNNFPWQSAMTAIAPASGGNVFNVTVSEAMSLADGLTSQAVFGNTLTEAAALGDSVGGNRTSIDTVSEALPLADVLAGGLATSNTLSEAMTLGDAQTVTVSFSGAVIEALALADGVTSQAVFQSNLTEPMALADALTSTAVYLCAILEASSLADFYSGTGGSPVTGGDLPNEFRTNFTFKIGPT